MMPLKRLFRCFALMAGFAMAGSAVHAACSSPAGDAGDVRYASNYNVLAFCDGTNWMSMAQPVGGGGGGASVLNDLTDVNTSGMVTGSILAYNGTQWVVSSTGSSAAEGDRITSGTHAVAVNETSGYVSLSTAGTTWGYLTSTRSYLPALSSVQVSSTNVSATLLQVGTGNGATCSASTKGAIRYSDTSSTVEYCQGTAWVSMGPSATDAIGFRAQNISTQTVAASTFEKMLLGNEIFDTNGNFASGRFTATVPGTYYFSGIVACKTTTGGCHGQLYVNGSAVLTGSFSSSENDNNSTVSGLLRLNSGDYVELWGRNSGATTMSTGTYLQGFLVGPQSGGGGGGGGGPTALGDLTNVNTAGAVAGSVIRYDGANWVVSDTSSALGDRITSGTSAVRIFDDGSVRLTTNGNNVLWATAAGEVIVGGTPLGASRFAVRNDQGGSVGRILFDANVSSGYVSSIIQTDTGLELTARSNSRAVVFRTGNPDTVKMTVTADGNVGIGETNPSHILHISGQGRATNSAWATSSDRRVKEDIHNLTGGLAAIEKLRPVTFRYTKDYQNGNKALDGVRRGFIAQEVEAVLPDVVTRDVEKFGDKEIKDFRVLGNSDFVPLLVSAVKELKSAQDTQAKAAQESEHRLRAEIDELRRELREMQEINKK